jgi:FAD/FMN-containing dehydrogenase
VSSLDAFAEAVGSESPVAVEGGRTQWEVGGLPSGSARLVRAPRGILEHRPEEMLVRTGAGTTVAELDAALSESAQMVPLDPLRPEQATVGGLLSVGRSGLRRLRYGPVRDHVLEIRYVSSSGALVRAGAPVVKNVSGFDLVRLLVGSLGTLGLMGELVLRTSPIPRAQLWLSRAGMEGEPAALLVRSLHRPSCVLWDGDRVWVLLEGHPQDVKAQAALLGPGWTEVEGPPRPPGPGRLSVVPAQLPTWASGRPPGDFLAEMGVGVVHLHHPAPAGAAPSPRVLDMHRRLKERFDPTGRLNPGRQVAA